MVILLLFVLLSSACPVLAIHGAWPAGSGADIVAGSCEFAKHTYLDEILLKAIQRIRPLLGKRYTYTEVTEPGRKPYRYDVGICTDASNQVLDNTSPRIDKDTVSYDAAAVMQWNSRREDEPPNVLGCYNDTEIMSGTDWVSLTYDGGDKHRHKCADEHRRSLIMIVCDPDEHKGRLTLTDENYNKTEDCYYLFELSHRCVCSKKSGRLGVGVIVCLIILAVVTLYLGVGVIIQRCVYHARGWEQLPNYNLWKKLGPRRLDSDLVCRRCGGDPSSYQDASGSDPEASKPANESTAISCSY